MRTKTHRIAFNRGLVSRLGLARADIKRLAMAAEVDTNWMPRVLGSMMLRPGLGYLGSTRDGLLARYLDFIFSVRDKALVELTDMAMRIWVPITGVMTLVTRAAVATAVTNGTFPTNLTGWTDADEVGGTSSWVASGGYTGLWVPAGLMKFVSNGTAYAIRRQQLTIAGADQGVEHGLHVRIAEGPVLLRIGTNTGEDDILRETSLEVGEHHLAFTPPSSAAVVEFKSQLERQTLVAQCTIDAAGVLESTAPWQEIDLKLVRYDQSGDVLFVGCGKTTNRIGYQQWRIERHSTNGWSVVLYRPEDGPFRVINVTSTTLSPTALSGDILLNSSAPVFRAGHVGALFQLSSIGQEVSSTFTTDNDFTDPIRVIGVGADRQFSISVTGVTATGSTVTLQRSFDGGATWVDYSGGIYTVDTLAGFTDGLDNEVVLYRLGVKTGDYVAGTILAQMAYSAGSITGVVRVSGFVADTQVNAQVLKNLGAATATPDWSEGKWSDVRGFPTSVAFHDGRLGWAGRDAIDLSISDAFDSFDPEFEGDAGPISRTIGSGPVDSVNWMLSLQRLLLGGEGAEHSVRSSSLDEPVTPTAFSIKTAATQGSAEVQSVKIDQGGIHAQRGGTRVYELAFGATGLDFESTDLTALIPEIGRPGIVKMAVQRQPDTRLHCVRSDGTAAVLIFDKVEQVLCWIEVETLGEIEDVVVLPGDPGDEEDWVFYEVKRTVAEVDVRYLEQWAFESECQGGQLCKLADSFVVYQGASTTVFPVTHLSVGTKVVVWVDGVDIGTQDDGTQQYSVRFDNTIHTVVAGTNAVIGLPYSATWKSAKLVELMSQGSFADAQMITSLGLILADAHPKGLKYGQSLVEVEMQSLPEVENGKIIDPDVVRADYSAQPMSFPGQWNQDARICLLAKAPRPVTVLAALAVVEHHG